ncbi:MAG TPA: phosphoserine transaminase [Acidimicrobiales bacterium]|nr:phosphoserine transaminase [Acidimicrobiales bacterium]
MADITIPEDLKPVDGRFGSGPSKVRDEAVRRLAAAAPTYLGTSHRQSTVRAVIGQLREGLTSFFALPDGYEVVLGNGGTTSFWDAATFCLIERQSQHLSFGEFSSKFAACAKAAPWLTEPDIIVSEAGTHPEAVARPAIDTYALTQNETSTGVQMPIRRPAGPDGQAASGLVLVDATSGAGGLRVDSSQFDCYYFAPQKCFGSDGGLWAAALSPAAVERVERLTSDRWVPSSLDLKLAVDNARLDQTYNTPALGTLHLFASQLDWFNSNGGLEFSASRCDRSAEIIYGWAEASSVATPFVAPAQRSHVVATIDFADSVDALGVAKILRANGIVDTEPYRKLGRNQLRVALFPSIEPSDVAALTTCIDYVVGKLG